MEEIIIFMAKKNTRSQNIQKIGEEHDQELGKKIKKSLIKNLFWVKV